VVHGSDGLDEITTTGPTRVAEVNEGAVSIYDLDPRDLGLERVDPQALAGGDPEHNARLMLAILEGQPGPLADVTLLNAGAALYVAGLAPDVAGGLALAREALASGAGQHKLEQLRRYREEA
jgi:anthranilate phosphoribosyltransferase